jgi:hypothetical protein
MNGSTIFRSIAAAGALMIGAASSAFAQPGAECAWRDTPNEILPGNPLWAVDLNAATARSR